MSAEQALRNRVPRSSSRRRQGVLPKSSAPVKVGRAVPSAPGEVVETGVFGTLRTVAARWGQHALPPTDLGNTPGSRRYPGFEKNAPTTVGGYTL
jgi:hypothetical protein